MIISLALFLTAFVMGPALQQSYNLGIKPLITLWLTPGWAESSIVDLYAALRPAGCQHLAGTRIDVLLSFEASLNAGGQSPQNPLDVNSFG